MDLRQFNQKNKSISAAYDKVIKACSDLLWNHPAAAEAKNYIRKRVSDYNLNLFSFGYFPDEDNLKILTDRVPEKILKHLGLIYSQWSNDAGYQIKVEKAHLGRHNLIMPYRDSYGNVIAIVGRTILEEDRRKDLNIQKYKYTIFNKSLHLFGLAQAKECIFFRDSVILVEGQIDCITCHEHGAKNTVALGGTSFGKYQFHLLRRWTKNFYLLLDNDAEGNRASNKIISQYGNLANFKKLNLPDGYKDIDSYLKNSLNNTIFDTIS